MLLFDSVASGNALLVTNQSSLTLFEYPKKDEKEFKKFAYEHSCEIAASNYLPKKGYLILTDVAKKFLMIDPHNGNAIIATKQTNKRAIKIIFSEDENSVVLGDKTGDAYLLNIESSDLANQEFKLIMGHLSMLTDLVLSLDRKFLITSDRDEKIRISQFPNSYNIENYLLGHKEFVIQINQINSNRLVSASGDSRLILWNLNEAKILQDINLLDFVNDETLKKSLKGVNRFDFDPIRNILLVHLFGSKFLMEFSYDHEKLFSFKRKIDLNEELISFVHLGGDFYLFLNLLNEKNPLAINKLENGKFNESRKDNENDFEGLDKLLSENIRIENAQKLKEEYDTNYKGYFKMVINNVEEYYERKKERIEATLTSKRKRIEDTDSNTSLNK